ncbi:hypothetical protein [Saccharolobus sp.]|uniref:hypothetical protein n=1 Tax=Saccharolobus sp. TaxID=2100761 RepID=UPI00316F8BE8
MSSMTPQPIIDEKVKKILDLVKKGDSKGDLILALGRLLSVKASGGNPSVYSVTKEIRRSIELVSKSGIDIIMAKYTNPPFDSEALNTAYRILLEELLKKLDEEMKDMQPMWRNKLINLVIENIYNIATAGETEEYKNQILKILKEDRNESSK